MSAVPETTRAGDRFDGWQLGLLAVGMAVLAAWLSLPRRVAPSRLPLPELDRRELGRLLESERERALRVMQGGLDFDVRAVGELVRRHGLATAQGDTHRALRAEQDVRARAQALLRRQGARGLLELRAVQTELFVSALADHERAPGTLSRELQELGGNFVEKARTTGWFDGSRSLLGEPALRVLFRVRWTELVGLRSEPTLRLTLTDYRVYYRTLLEHPEGRSEADKNAHRLSYVAALARRDGQYPRELARGVLLYRLGQPATAATALLQHLQLHPDGPWALYAKNYAMAALAELPIEE